MKIGYKAILKKHYDFTCFTSFISHITNNFYKINFDPKIKTYQIDQEKL